MKEPAQPLYRFGRWLFWNWFRLYGLRCYGWENVPSEGPCLIVCNHQSFMDPPVLGCSVPHRQVHFMAKKELFRLWPMRMALQGVGCFPVDRHRSDRAAMKRATELLNAASVVGLFPEGTRSHDNTMGPWHPGAAVLVARTGVPVVPAAVVNTRQNLEERRLVPGGPPVSIRFGAPIRLDQEELEGRDRVRYVLERLHRAVSTILEEMATAREGSAPWPSSPKER
ncbi:MAG: 1-acyl-sn-glycerol-3-phosphate acyltransferase [Armatimonadetes bacterium]|nr:1-acyl-sn-glycerol-3-phosphate acyltransferase [Armatimonadota bacterium]